MSEPKPFASLSSGLLARKGAARPAMRPQGFGQVGEGLEDLGWDDMGLDPPKPAETPERDSNHDALGEEIDDEPRQHPTGLTPIHSPVHTQQAELAERLGADGEEDEEFDETAELYDPEGSFAVQSPVSPPEHLEADETSEVEQSFDTDETAEQTFEPEQPFEAEQSFEPEDTFEPEQSFEADPEPEFRPVLATKPHAIAPARIPTPAPAAAPMPTPAPSPVRAPRAVNGTKPKAAFTLRLDPERHLKLRLACAVNGRSAQQIVTDAVDQLLAEFPELDAMAEKAKRKG